MINGGEQPFQQDGIIKELAIATVRLQAMKVLVTGLGAEGVEPPTSALSGAEPCGHDLPQAATVVGGS
jgi:hypothetical protein